MRPSISAFLVLGLLVAALAWAFWPSSSDSLGSTEAELEVIDLDRGELAEAPTVASEGAEREVAEPSDVELEPKTKGEASDAPVSVICRRGILEFMRREPDAQLQVWTLANEETGAEASLFSEAVANSEGHAICQVPITQGFEVRAESLGDQASWTVKPRDAAELERSYPNGIPILFQSKKATIAVTGEVLGSDKPVYLRLQATPDEHPRALLANRLRFSAQIKAENPDYRFESTIEVPAGFPMHLGVYSQEGERIANLFTGRALQAGETWPCEITIDLDQIYRNYFFQFTGDEGKKPGGIFGDIQVVLFDVATKFGRRNANFPHEVGKVYSMRVVIDQPIIARVKDSRLGGAEWVVMPGAGETESNPEVIALQPPVRILIPKDAGDVALAQLPKRIELSYPYGMPEGRRLEWLEDLGVYTIFGPQIAEIQGLRLGNRLFRCSFSAGGDYRLGGPSVAEVQIAEVASAQFQVKSDFKLDDSVLFMVEHAGLLWAYVTIQSRGSSSINHAIDLPVGISTVTIRYGASDLVQTFLVEVGATGGTFPVTFSRS